MNVLVIPTNRPDRMGEFLGAWRPRPWDTILIVEDAPEVSGTGNCDRILRYCWQDIERSLSQPGIISRGDSAIRAYGFWKAWAMGADVIFTLDDDCFPVEGDYVRQHVRNLEATPACHSSVPGLRVRGLPYANTGALRNIYVSMGLWVGHSDIDSIQVLAHPGRRGDAVLDRGLASRVMPSDEYVRRCGCAILEWRKLFDPGGGQSDRE